MDWTTWIIVPAVGALIGWITNTIAVLMLFRPHEPRRLFGLRFHGLIPKRQAALAHKIGNVVGTHLVSHEDIVAAVGRLELRPMIERVIDRAIERKVAELRSLPMIGGFLTPERLAGIRGGIVDAVLAQEEVLVEQLESAIENNLDVQAIVEAKVGAFPTPRLEALVLEVSRRELRAIELWGAILGAVIGLAQVALLEVLR